MLQSTGLCLHEQRSIIEDAETREGICTKCGTVVYQLEEAPTAAPAVEGERARPLIKREANGWVGSNTTRINPVTKMGDLDSKGRRCQANQFYSRLKALNRQAYPRKQQYIAKCVVKGQYAIRRLADKLHLSEQIIERAFQLYSKAARAQLIRGRSITGIAAAVVYLACKDCGTPRSALEFRPFIENESDRKRFFKDYQRVLNLRGNNPTNAIVPVVDSKVEMARIMSKIQGDPACLRLACGMYDRIKEAKPLEFDGKHPTCLAVALLYVASMRIAFGARGWAAQYTPVRQNVISNASGVSMVSLRLRYKNILKDLVDIHEIDEEEYDMLLRGHGSWKRL
jgi:transcription initiation factor TFIIB